MLRKGIALFVCAAFFVTSGYLPQASAEISPTPAVSFRSLTNDLTAIAIPKEIGKIQETYRGSGDEVVVLIQDAHSIPDAQHSIRSAIDHFQTQYGVSLVGLEGASEKLDPQIFKSFPDKELLRKTFDAYAGRGELTGGTAAALFNASPGTYQGIEDWSLYEEGVSYYLQAMKMEPEIKALLDPMAAALNKEKGFVYSKEMFEIDRLLADFGENKTDLVQILNKLAEYQLPPKGSELAVLLEEIKLSGSDENNKFSPKPSLSNGDKGQMTDTPVEIEIKKIAQKVEAVLKERSLDSARDDLRIFNQKYQEFRIAQVTPQAFALYLKGLAKKYGVRVKVSRKLAYLTEHQKRLKDIEGTRLFEDFKRYADSVKESLFQSLSSSIEAEQKLGQPRLPSIKEKQESGQNDRVNAMRVLDQKSKGLDLIKRLARLELSFEDWGKVQKMMLQLDQWTVTQDRIVSWEEVTALLKKMEPQLAFYRIAEKRDKVFRENIQSMMEKAKQESSLLVAGGFHTEGLTRELKEKGISYVLVMPSIGSIPEEPLYREHMQGQVSWSNYFEVKNGKVNLYDAFVRAARDKLLGDKNASAIVGKEWRDQIIRDLASEGRVTEAGNYTHFIDELSSNSRLQTSNLKERWLANIDRFGEGLKQLQAEGNLSESSILQLIRTITIPEVSLANQLAPDGRTEIRLLPWLMNSLKMIKNAVTGKKVQSSAKYVKNGEGGVFVWNGDATDSVMPIEKEGEDFFINTGDLAVFDSDTYPNVSLVTRNLSACTGVAINIRASANYAAHYGLGHIYIRWKDKGRSLADHVQAIHNRLLGKGFRASDIEYIIDYRDDSYSRSPEEEERGVQARVPGVIAQFHRRLNEEGEIIDGMRVTPQGAFIDRSNYGKESARYGWQLTREEVSPAPDSGTPANKRPETRSENREESGAESLEQPATAWITWDAYRAMYMKDNERNFFSEEIPAHFLDALQKMIAFAVDNGYEQNQEIGTMSGFYHVHVLVPSELSWSGDQKVVSKMISEKAIGLLGHTQETKMFDPQKSNVWMLLGEKPQGLKPAQSSTAVQTQDLSRMLGRNMTDAGTLYFHRSSNGEFNHFILIRKKHQSFEKVQGDKNISNPSTDWILPITIAERIPSMKQKPLTLVDRLFERLSNDFSKRAVTGDKEFDIAVGGEQWRFKRGVQDKEVELFIGRTGQSHILSSLPAEKIGENQYPPALVKSPEILKLLGNIGQAGRSEARVDLGGVPRLSSMERGELIAVIDKLALEIPGIQDLQRVREIEAFLNRARQYLDPELSPTVAFAENDSAFLEAGEGDPVQFFLRHYPDLEKIFTRHLARDDVNTAGRLVRWHDINLIDAKRRYFRILEPLLRSYGIPAVPGIRIAAVIRILAVLQDMQTVTANAWFSKDDRSLIDLLLKAGVPVPERGENERFYDYRDRLMKEVIERVMTDLGFTRRETDTALAISSYLNAPIELPWSQEENRYIRSSDDWGAEKIAQLSQNSGISASTCIKLAGLFSAAAKFVDGNGLWGGNFEKGAWFPSVNLEAEGFSKLAKLSNEDPFAGERDSSLQKISGVLDQVHQLKQKLLYQQEQDERGKPQPLIGPDGALRPEGMVLVHAAQGLVWDGKRIALYPNSYFEGEHPLESLPRNIVEFSLNGVIAMLNSADVIFMSPFSEASKQGFANLWHTATSHVGPFELPEGSWILIRRGKLAEIPEAMRQWLDQKKIQIAYFDENLGAQEAVERSILDHGFTPMTITNNITNPFNGTTWLDEVKGLDLMDKAHLAGTEAQLRTLASNMDIPWSARTNDYPLGKLIYEMELLIKSFNGSPGGGQNLYVMRGDRRKLDESLNAIPNAVAQRFSGEAWGRIRAYLKAIDLVFDFQNRLEDSLGDSIYKDLTKEGLERINPEIARRFIQFVNQYAGLDLKPEEFTEPADYKKIVTEVLNKKMPEFSSIVSRLPSEFIITRSEQRVTDETSTEVMGGWVAEALNPVSPQRFGPEEAQHIEYVVVRGELDALIRSAIQVVGMELAKRAVTQEVALAGGTRLTAVLDCVAKILKFGRVRAEGAMPVTSQITLALNFSKDQGPGLASFYEELFKVVLENGLQAEIFSDRDTGKVLAQKVSGAMREVFNLRPLSPKEIRGGIAVTASDGQSAIPMALDAGSAADANALNEMFQGLFFNAEGMNMDADTQFAIQALFAAILIKVAIIAKEKKGAGETIDLKAELIRALQETGYPVSEQAFKKDGRLITIMGNALLRDIEQAYLAQSETQKAA